MNDRIVKCERNCYKCMQLLIGSNKSGVEYKCLKNGNAIVLREELKKQKTFYVE